nr:hypothetical protein [Tanacetum cinerariifolium]
MEGFQSVLFLFLELRLKEIGCLWCSGAPYPWSPRIPFPHLVVGLEVHCVGNKMHKAFPLSVIKFPLVEDVPAASKESSHCQKKRDANAMMIALLLKVKE